MPYPPPFVMYSVGGSAPHSYVAMKLPPLGEPPMPRLPGPMPLEPVS